MVVMNLSRILIIPCEMFFRIQLKSIMVVTLIISYRGKVDGRGDAL